MTSAATTKFVLIPEELYKGLTSSALRDTGDANLDFTRRSLEAVKREPVDASRKNQLYNQRLRRYLHLRKQTENKPLKVQIASVAPGVAVATKQIGNEFGAGIGGDEFDTDDLGLPLGASAFTGSTSSGSTFRPPASESGSRHRRRRHPKNKSSSSTVTNGTTSSKRTSLAETEQTVQPAGTSTQQQQQQPTDREQTINHAMALMNSNTQNWGITAEGGILNEKGQLIARSHLRHSLEWIVDKLAGKQMRGRNRPQGTSHLEQRIANDPMLKNLLLVKTETKKTPSLTSSSGKSAASTIKQQKDPEEPTAYASVNPLWKAAKQHLPTIRKRDVRHWLEQQRTYTLHKPQRLRFPRQRTVPAGLCTDVQMDLADFQKLARHNAGARYALVGVDVLSKRFFATPIKNKSPNEIVPALRRLFEQMPMIPQRLYTDKGTEFEGRQVKKFLTEQHVAKHRPASSIVKAAIAERAIRTLKARLYKYMSEKETLNWTTVLPQIIDGINRSVSRTHGMAPAEVTFQNAQRVWEKMYGSRKWLYQPTDKKWMPNVPKLHVGDHVRMSKNRAAFHKSYLPGWTDEILQIDSVRPSNPFAPNRYAVHDLGEQHEPFEGLFYQDDLQRVRLPPDETYRVNVLRSRKRNGRKEFLVQYLDGPPKQPRWINETDLV